MFGYLIRNENNNTAALDIL